MPMLIRKFSRGKWQSCIANDSIPYPADAITSCLRTTNNTLSVWQVESEDDLLNAKIAILSTTSQITTVDLVFLESEELAASELVVEATDGKIRSPVLNGLHRDIVKLTLDELIKVAGVVRNTIREERVERITKPQFVQIMRDAISRGLVTKDDLSKELKKDFFETV